MIKHEKIKWWKLSQSSEAWAKMERQHASPDRSLRYYESRLAKCTINNLSSETGRKYSELKPLELWSLHQWKQRRFERRGNENYRFIVRRALGLEVLTNDIHVGCLISVDLGQSHSFQIIDATFPGIENLLSFTYDKITCVEELFSRWHCGQSKGIQQ